MADKDALIDQVVSLSLQKDGGRTPCARSRWRDHAAFLVDFAMKTGPVSNDTVQLMASMVVEKIRTSFQPSRNFIVPQVCPILASQLDGNSSQKRTYEETTLSPHTGFGAFVSVKSYTQFCLGMTTNYELQQKTKKIMQERISLLFPREENKKSPSEKPRSAQLARLLQVELAEVDVECVHQFPIVPKSKTFEQNVDVGFILDGAIPAILEYKPLLNFEAFASQASVFATDTMALSSRPCLIVQVRGEALDQLDFRVYGIVVNYYEAEPTHKRSLLLDAHGVDGLKLFISGLTAYMRAFVHERAGEWHQGYLSNVVSVHEEYATSEEEEAMAVVYKAYDYRLRNSVPTNDRRRPNIELLRQFVDANAQVKSMEDFDLVSSKFLKRTDGESWYGPVESKKVAKIVRDLKKLHENNFVHGDIRLRNMVLHEGVLTDFDYTQTVDSCYPSTLLDIQGDGIRHPEVKAAIEAQDRFEREKEPHERVHKRPSPPPIGELGMKFEHDVDAMKYVLAAFDSVDKSRSEEWRNIVHSDDLWAMPDLMDKFGGKVEFSAAIEQQATPH